MALARALPPRTVPEAYCIPSARMAGWNCCLAAAEEDDEDEDANEPRATPENSFSKCLGSDPTHIERACGKSIYIIGKMQ